MYYFIMHGDADADERVEHSTSQKIHGRKRRKGIVKVLKLLVHKVHLMNYVCNHMNKLAVFHNFLILLLLYLEKVIMKMNG